MVLIRWPLDWNGPKRLRGLLDFGFTLYGLATLALVLLLAITNMPLRTFMHLFSVLLFVVGTLLAVDGFFGLRTGLDRTGKRLRSGGAARLLGFLKIAGGILAALVMVVGISLGDEVPDVVAPPYHQ